MKEINIDELLKEKKSDTLVIFGSGPSINNLSKEDFNILNKFDTMSFNMFLKTKIPVKFYILGECLDNYYNSKNKNLLKVTKEDDLNIFNNIIKYYNNSIIILWNSNYYNNKKYICKKIIKNKVLLLNVKKYYTWHEIGKLIKKNYINKNEYKNYFKNNIILHQNVGLNSCIYLGFVMGYKKIIFVGVDLNNYEYAFNRDEFRKTIIKENINMPHRSRDHVVSFINYLKNDITFNVYNKDSYLSKIINIFY